MGDKDKRNGRHRATVDLLRELTPADKKYKPVRRFPSSAFDLSIVAPERELAATLASLIRRFSGELTESVKYFDQYQLPEARKSFTYRVTVGAPDRTLSSSEITAIRNGIIEGLAGLGYELRV